MYCLFIDALPIMRNGAQLFQQYMAEIGIEVELRGMETNTWVETVVETGDYYFTTNLDLGGPTPESILNAIGCDGWAAPVYGPCSTDIDVMVQAAAAATDPAERVAIWKDIQTAVAEFQPTATWIYARNHVVATQSRVHGFVPFPDKAHRQLEDVWITT
jgi:ABC-type transport system substrate-binding protein